MAKPRRAVNLIDSLLDTDREQSRRIEHSQNRKRNSLAIYDLSNLPPLINGEIFLGTDGSLCWVVNDVIYTRTGTVI